MTDTLEIFDDIFTGVTGIKATDSNDQVKIYIRPQGTKSIFANGTGIDVAEYASVDVSVSGGLDMPTFTVVWDDDWEEIVSITCDKTYAECNNIKFDCWYASITDRNQTGTEIYENTCFAPVTTQGGHLEYTAVYNFLASYDIAYYPNGTITLVQPSSHLETLNITQNGSYYPQFGTIQEVNVSVSGGTPTLQNKTVSPSESQQSVQADSGYDGLGTVTVNAISSTYVGSGITQRSSSDLTASGATVTVPAGYYASQATKSISNGSATGPSSLSASSATITTGTNTITLTKTGVTTTPTVSAGYVSDATASTATVALTASVTVNPTLTVSGATVTAPAGYYSTSASQSVSSMTLPTSAASSATSGYTSKATIGRSTAAQYINIPPGYNSTGAYYVISAVANGSATAPSTISGTAASVSTGTNTLTLTKTVSVTPTVTAGYVSAGTAGNASVSLTASVTTKAAATITPTTTNQTIASGTYLTGTQTIAGDADLVGSNILSTANIFGVQGEVVVQNYYTGSSAPSSSLGSNGDLYLQT